MLESGSDYSGFYMMYGIPALDVRYEFDKVRNYLIDNVIFNIIIIIQYKPLCSLHSDVPRPHV